MSDGRINVLEQLRERDPERYIACLYLPETVRLHAACIYLFDAEIARIPDLVSEPMPGEIRLQFWRDVLAKGSADGAGPLAEALLETIAENNLPAETLHNYLNARIFDLYQDPMPDMGSFEGYLGETHSALFQLVALCSGVTRSTELANACGHAGMAFGISRFLSVFSWHHHNRRIYIPKDVLSRNKLTTDQWLDETPDISHLNVISDMVQLARDHQAKAVLALKELPKDAKGAFIPLSFVDPLLKKIEKRGIEIFKAPVKLSGIQRQWAAFSTALKR